MTTNTITPNVDYIEDGATLTHPIPFKFLSDTDLVVQRISAGVAETLTLGLDYAATGAGDASGGTLVKTAAGSSGVTLRIKRLTTRGQGFDYTPHDTFMAESHETALDRQSLVNQEQDVDIIDTKARAFLVPEGEAGGELPVAAARANKFQAYGPSGTLIMSAGTGADLGLRQDLADDELGGRLISVGNGKFIDSVICTADVTLYVRTTGDDTTGDGSSEAKAFASVQRALDALPIIADDKSYLIDVGAGTFSTSNRPAYTVGSPEMPRNALLYIDRLRNGKRTAQFGSSLSGSLVIKGAGQGVTILEPGATYPRGIYGTGNIGSIGLVDMTVRGGVGAESCVVTHRGCYLHGRRVDLDGNGNAVYGLICEAGGKAEMIDCNATGSTSDVYAYPGGQIQFASPANDCTIGKIYSSGTEFSLGQNVVVTGRAQFLGGSFLAAVSSAQGAIDFQGDCSFEGCPVLGPWINWTGEDRRLELHDSRGHGDAWKFKAQMLLFNSTVEGNGHHSYIVELDYDAEAAAFAKGETVTGGTSGAVGVVWQVVDAGGGAGTLIFSSVTGAFTDGETLTGSVAGSATANGASSAARSPHVYPVLLHGEGSQYGQSWDYNTRAWRAANNKIIGSDGVQRGPAYDHTKLTFEAADPDPSGTALVIPWNGNREIFCEVKNNRAATIGNMTLPGVIPTGRNAGDRWPEGQMLTLYYGDASLMTMLPGTTMTLPYGSSMVFSTAASHFRAARFVWVSSLNRWLCLRFTQTIQTAPTNNLGSTAAYVAPAGGATVDAEARSSLALLAARVAALEADFANEKSKIQAAKIHA